MSKRRITILIIFILIFIIAIIFSVMYYKNKYSIHFETGTDELIINQYVKKYCKVKRPTDPKKEGYVFKEWQLNGKEYNFNSRVDRDIDLTAKWIKEDYITINFETNSPHKIKSKKVLKGEVASSLPLSKKDNYEFIGWYLNGKLYSEEEVHSNITLYAEYKNDTFNTTYKLNDKVIITGNYSDSAYSEFAYYSEAIGWDRKILYIISDSNYPYAVGNEFGVTGYFKASSIREVN